MMRALLRRKDVAEMASSRMKQLQWDKLAPAIAAESIWGSDGSVDENALAMALKSSGLFQEMETEFRAQTHRPKRGLGAANARSKAQLTTHLTLQTRQGIELVLRRVRSRLTGARNATPEEVADDIIHCRSTILDQGFLSELLRHYPESETKGQLGQYRNASAEELRLLHETDRLVVLLMTVPHLKEKVRGLLYYTRYRESYDLIESASSKIRKGSEQLMNAPHFSNLLRIILTMGNFLNAAGVQGGAFGFKISSINKLVDTKAADGATLLHYVERSVKNCFQETEGFLTELETPAEACRGVFFLPNPYSSLNSVRAACMFVRHELVRDTAVG